MARERLTLGILLASIFLVRAIHPDQPIVENYVGRQIPTAMVARNLERGHGFFRPQLDTAPFPNLFLVEPPIYAQIVASFRPILSLKLEPTGRLVSAASVVLGAWGLFGLVRRRDGLTVAFLALASFGLFPVMIRFGRAFQPDPLMVGCVLAGLRGWDEYEESGNWRWAVFGGFVLSTALTVKITMAWVLIPFVLILRRWSVSRRLAVSTALLIPASLWYLYAWNEVRHPGSGSMANAESTTIWLNVLFSTQVWLRLATYKNLAQGLFVNSFTPVGFVLAAYGLLASGKLDRLWWGWALGTVLSIVGLASKWHHAYYWMVVAPLAAVGVGRGLVHLARLGRLGRLVACGLASFFLALCVVQSASTFKTPGEWESLNEATLLLKSFNEFEELVAAPEAVLYYSDLRGYRLEFDPEAKRRAASEWKIELKRPDLPLSLTEFYRDAQRIGFLDDSKPLELQGRPRALPSKVRFIVTDVGSVTHEPRRRAWREAIRQRPNTRILADKPGYLIAELR